MDIWKDTKIKAKTRLRKGVRLEWKGGFCARRKAVIGFCSRSGCEGGGICCRIELWLEGRTGCAWPGAGLLEGNWSTWSERNVFRAVGGCGYLITTLFLLVRRLMELPPTEVKQMVFSTHLVNYPPYESKVRMLTNHI